MNEKEFKEKMYYQIFFGILHILNYGKIKMGRKMTRLDNSNKLFLHTLGNQVGRAKIQRNRDIKKNRFLNTIQTISKKTK